MTKMLTLENVRYEVASESEIMISLKGPRGGKYSLVRNVSNPSLWAMARANSRKPVTTWFQRQFDGSFERVR